MFTCSTLDTSSLRAVQRLESEIGAPVVALTEIPSPPADLDTDAVAKVEALEKELDLVLVAVKDKRRAQHRRRSRRMLARMPDCGGASVPWMR